MTSMFALWAGTLLALGGSVTEVTITPMESQTNILVVTGELVEYRSFVMEGPHRLVIDLMGATHALPRTEFSASFHPTIAKVSHRCESSHQCF